MFNLSQKERGAVAVFLIIVLVPMITCAALFVEVSRIKLAQSLVSSASDLALNTVLTRYDQELNEFYGMLASAQETEDVINATQDYFEVCLKSQQVDTTFIKKYVNSLSGLFSGGSDISDFLDISVLESEFSVAPTENGNLTNAALIKTQIVDFMKYRSPINLAGDLLDMLTKTSNAVEDIPDETKCLEEQQEFYDTEESLLDTAYKAYKQLKKFLDLKISKTYIENALTNLNGYEATYKQMHRKLVYDLAGTKNITKFEQIAINVDAKMSDYKQYTEYNKDTAPSKMKDVKDWLGYVSTSLFDYLDAKSNLNSLYNRFSYGDDTHLTRFYVNIIKELNKNNQYSIYASEANDLIKKVTRLKNLYEALPDTEDTNQMITMTARAGVNASGKMTIKAAYESLISQYNGIVNDDFKNKDGAYKVIGHQMANICKDIYEAEGALPAAGQKPDGGINRSPVTTHITTIHTEINGYYTTIKDGIEQIETAVATLNSLKKIIGSYKSDFNNWKSAANKSTLDDSGVAKESKKDISARESDPEIMDNITVEGVEALVNRLNNIKSALGEVKSVIEALKYNGTKIVDIDSFEDFESASGVKTSDIPLTKTEIETYATNTYSFESKTSTLNITDNNNPDFDNVNTPPLYKWMKQYFVENKPENKKNYTEESANSKYDSFKDKKKELDGEKDKDGKPKDNSEKSEITTNAKTQLKDISNKPSGGDGVKVEEAKKSSDLSGISTFVSNLFGNFGTTMKNLGTTVRDDLFTIDYIMSMFTYDTWEQERRLELWVESHPNEKITKTTNFMNATADQWKNTELTFKDNKTLTNQMKISSNHYSYGNEVEYILYGGSNSTNKAASYGTILMLRLALDAGAVFAEYFTHNAVTTIANSVAAATCGVVPAPLVQFAICLALTITEAALDLTYLKKGIGVPIVKTHKDELFVSFTGDDVSKTKGATTTDLADTGANFPFLQYGDYLTIFLFIALLDTNKANAIYKRTADVIQANMGVRTGDDGYALSKAHMYYTLTTTVEVAPLVLPAPLIDGNITDIKESQEYRGFAASKWNSFSYTLTRGY